MTMDIRSNGSARPFPRTRWHVLSECSPTNFHAPSILRVRSLPPRTHPRGAIGARKQLGGQDFAARLAVLEEQCLGRNGPTRFKYQAMALVAGLRRQRQPPPSQDRHGPIAITTASPSTISPLASATPGTAPLGPCTKSTTVPCRSVAPSISAARIKPVVNARGSTSAVDSGEPSELVIATPSESHGRPPGPRAVSSSAA